MQNTIYLKAAAAYKQAASIRHEISARYLVGLVSNDEYRVAMAHYDKANTIFDLAFDVEVKRLDEIA